MCDEKCCRGQLKRDGTRTETKFSLSVKGTSPFELAGASVQSTTGSRGVRISGSNAGYSMFRGSVKTTGYPLHLPVSPSLPLPCITMCHHISAGVYLTHKGDPFVVCPNHFWISVTQGGHYLLVQGLSGKYPAILNISRTGYVVLM